MLWFAIFFFLSGLCSLVYELVWLRLAMARFGVTTALVSILLSVFMAGLGAGSWLAGRWVRRYGDRIKFPPLRLYAICELVIGASALLVPLELSWGVGCWKGWVVMRQFRPARSTCSRARGSH